MMSNQRLKNLNVRFYPQKLFYAPEWIVLGVNNLCNLHCKMCDVGTQFEKSNFYYNLMGSRPLNMPLDLIMLIIEQTSLYFPKAKLGFAFTEPLIYPHLIESITMASAKNLHTALTTNALTLKKKAEDLVEAGLKELFISLDGPSEIHNFIRGNKRSFEKAILGIEKIISISKSKPGISIFCTVTEWNIGHLIEFIEVFLKLPIKQIGFMHTNYTPNTVVEIHNQIYGNSYPATISNIEEINLGNFDLDKLLSEIIYIKKNDYPFPVTFSPDLITVEELETFYLKPEKIIGNICNDAFRTIMIKSNGSVIPSHGRCYNIDVGNIYETSLKDIWNSAILAKFRKTLIDAGGLLPACSRCCSAF